MRTEYEKRRMRPPVLQTTRLHSLRASSWARLWFIQQSNSIIGAWRHFAPAHPPNAPAEAHTFGSRGGLAAATTVKSDGPRIGALRAVRSGDSMPGLMR